MYYIRLAHTEPENKRSKTMKWFSTFVYSVTICLNNENVTSVPYFVFFLLSHISFFRSSLNRPNVILIFNVIFFISFESFSKKNGKKNDRLIFGWIFSWVIRGAYPFLSNCFCCCWTISFNLSIRCLLEGKLMNDIINRMIWFRW